MKRFQYYTCSTCGATKEIIDDKNESPVFPDKVPCGWRGCVDYARPT
jgi:hypothetical protein